MEGLGDEVWAMPPGARRWRTQQRVCSGQTAGGWTFSPWEKTMDDASMQGGAWWLENGEGRVAAGKGMLLSEFLGAVDREQQRRRWGRRPPAAAARQRRSRELGGHHGWDVEQRTRALRRRTGSAGWGKTSRALQWDVSGCSSFAGAMGTSAHAQENRGGEGVVQRRPTRGGEGRRAQGLWTPWPWLLGVPARLRKEREYCARRLKEKRGRNGCGG
jgi:hypothetical protein